MFAMYYYIYGKHYQNYMFMKDEYNSRDNIKKCTKFNS